jgi:hypothetical protein
MWLLSLQAAGLPAHIAAAWHIAKPAMSLSLNRTTGSPAHLPLPACVCCCQVIVVNGKPVPTVRANAGDRIIIKVINQIDDPISVHW